MEWYYSNSGVQSGPVSIEDLRGKMASGEVLGADLVWRDGMSDWMPASIVPELSGGRPPVTPGGGPGEPAYPMAPQTPGLAVASLVCGLVGLLGFFACWVPGLVGIGGIICGHMALKKIKSNEEQYIGKGLAIGGLVTGYLAIFLMIVMTIFFAGVMTLGHKASESSSKELSELKLDLTKQMEEEAAKDASATAPSAVAPDEPEE